MQPVFILQRYLTIGLYCKRKQIIRPIFFEIISIFILTKIKDMASIDWQKEIQPLLKKYKGKKHPLDYHNTYELLVMVVLSAQDSDAHINKIAPDFFNAFPDMKALSKANESDLFPLIGKVRNFGNKTKWLLELSAQIKEDKNIPKTLEG